MKRSAMLYVALFFVGSLFCPSLVGTLNATEITSPDQLQMSDFRVSSKVSPIKVGDTVRVSFKLKNVSSSMIQFHPDFGVFVGARWNSTTDANNRDFGHKYKGLRLRPGTTLSFAGYRKLDAAGTWRFWPAYNVNGHWGPFRWNETVIEVAASGMPSPPRDKATSHGNK